jgi:hypothetical protein
MSSETEIKAPRILRVQVMLGPFGGVHECSINLDDDEDVIQKINGLVELAKSPLVGRINALSIENESLKKRVLSTDEIQRLACLLKTHSTETRFDGRPTNDDLLVSKLESMSASR